jgi:dTMP kinase
VFYLALPAEEAARRIKARGYDEEDPAYLSAADPAHLAAADAAYGSLPEFLGPRNDHCCCRTRPCSR